MMRKSWGGLCAAILLVGLISLGEVSAAESLPDPATPVRLLAVEGVAQPGGTSLQVRTSGPFRFTSYQPHARNLIVDLAGVVAEPGTLEPAAGVSWIAGYRLLPFRNASGRTVLRLDLNLKRDCDVELTQAAPTTLTLTCPSAEADSVAAAAPAPLASTAEGSPGATEPQVGSQAPTAGSNEPVRVRRFVVNEQDDVLTVKVQATAPLRYETMILENPTRLVIDLPHSILLSRPRQLAVDQEPIVGVRMAQFKAQPPITRLVVDLLKMVPYDIEATPEGLRLTLQHSTTSTQQQPPPPPPAAPVAVAPATPAPPQIRKEAPTEAGKNDSESSPVLLASLAPTIPATMESAPVPGAVAKPVEVARAEEALLPSQPVTATEEMAAETPVEVEQAPPTEEAAAPEQRFTGEPISVNLKEVDILDFFRLIHEISGLNIVVDPNVSGRVTLVLIDVPWDQALDIVLRNNGLGSTLEGNVLRIATLATLKKEQEDARELAQARAEAVDAVTRTYELSYARASDLEPTLKRFLSSRGELIRDERTNTLILRDIPTVIPQIENLINQLDRKSLQVEIEARVVSASRAFSREIGSQFATSFSTTGGRSTFGGALGASQFSALPPPPLVSGTFDPTAPEPVPQPLASDLAVGAATSGFLFGHRSPNFALDVILTAAESRNIAKVLSKPRLITQNNIQAEVKQGTRIPVQTVVNNTISTQFIDVVLKLTVTPQITVDGTVFLDIDIENTAIDPGIARINGIPALATQRTTTQVLVRDGGTIVVGGVMVTNNSTTVDQVPLLGSIPIIGHLFKRTTVSTDTRELLFFITPRILQS